MANSAVVGLLRVILTANAAEFEQAMGKASTTAAKWSKDLNKMGAEATRVGAALTKTLTVPMVAIGAGAAKLAIDFESAFAGVRKTVDATEPEFKAMENAFRDLAKTIPVPVTELARLGEAAGALGIPKAEIVDFSRVMALLGVTTNVTSDQAAESIAQIQTQFKSAGKDTEKFASALVFLGNHGASTEKQILELSTRLASAGNAAGMSQAQVLGWAAAMANVGIEAEAGGTALSRTFNEINAAVARGGAELTAFAQVAGVSAEEFAEKFRTDASGAVQMFVEGLARIHKEGGSIITTLDDLGIKEARQGDTLRRLALNTQNVADALKDANEGWRSTALADEANKRFETTASKLQLLWQRIGDVGIQLGNALLPTIKLAISALDDLLPILDGLVKGFEKLPVPVQATAIALGAVAAAAGPVIWGLGQLISAGGAIAGIFKEGSIGATVLTTSINGLGKAFAFIAANPITLVIAAIGALAVAWANFKDDWTRAFDVLIPPLGVFRNAIDNVKAGLEPYKQQIDDIATIVRGVWNEAWDSAARKLAEFRDAALKKIGEAFEKIKPIIEGVAQSIKDTLPFAIGVAKAALAPFITSINLLLAAEKKLAEWSEVSKTKLHDIANGYRVAAAANGPLQATTLATAESFGFIAASVGQASAALRGADPAVQSMTAMLKAIRAEVAGYTAEQRKEIAAGKEAGLTTKQITENLNKLYPGLKATEGGVDAYTDALKRNTQAGQKATEQWKRFLEQSREFGQQSATFDISEIGRFSDLAGPVDMEMQSLIDRTAKLSAEQRRTIDTSLELGRTTKQIAADMNLGVDVVERYADQMKDLWKANDDLNKKSAGTTAWVNTWETQAGTLQELLAATVYEVEHLSAEQLKNIEAGRAMGMSLEEIAKAAGVSVEALKLLKKGTGSLSDSFKAAIGDLPKVIMSTLQGGGDLGKSIGSLFGANIFGAESNLVKNLTGKLSGVLGKTLGGAIGSILPGLGTLLGSGLGSLASKAFGKLFGGGEHKKVNDMRDGFVKAAGGIHELNVKAQAAGLTLDRFLRAKTVKEYEAAVAELQGAFDRLAANKEAAGGLFEQIMEMGAQGIPAAFRPAIEQFIELGLLTDEQAQKLRDMGDGAVLDVDKMRSAMEALNGRVESLGPAFRQAEIDKTAQGYINAIDTLIKGGGDVGGILFDAKEEVSDLVNQSKKFGTTLPANMQPWIEELKRAGLLLDENGNKITDTSDLKYGEAMKTEAEIAEQGWNDILAAIRDLIDEIRGPLDDALDDVTREPRHVRIVYDVDPSETGDDADTRGYQEGTKGRLGEWWANFNRGTDTRLHGWEAVVTPEQAVPFSLATLDPLLSRLAPAGPMVGGDTTTNTSTNVALVVAPQDLDPSRIANEVFRQWPSAMQQDRHGMLSTIERAIEDYHRTYGHG